MKGCVFVFTWAGCRVRGCFSLPGWGVGLFCLPWRDVGLGVVFVYLGGV